MAIPPAKIVPAKISAIALDAAHLFNGNIIANGQALWALIQIIIQP